MYGNGVHAWISLRPPNVPCLRTDVLNDLLAGAERNILAQNIVDGGC